MATLKKVLQINTSRLLLQAKKTFIQIKMSHYWFSRQELLEKAKDRYQNGGGKQEAADYYIANKDVLEEKAKNKYKNLP